MKKLKTITLNQLEKKLGIKRMTVYAHPALLDLFFKKGSHVVDDMRFYKKRANGLVPCEITYKIK